MAKRQAGGLETAGSNPVAPTSYKYMQEHIIKTKLQDIKDAEARLKRVLKPTPLFESPYFSELSKNKIYFKPENLQITGSYKIRGAYNKICALPKQSIRNGLIAASAGNHAQGVAYAAKKLNLKAIIVMPKSTPLVKIQATKQYGVEVILWGDCYDEAYDYAVELAKKKELTFIHPFNDWDVIAGQGTIGLEILEDLSDAEVIVVPVGGGGLIAGIAITAKKINPKIKIIGVEPKGAAAMNKSLASGEIIELKEVITVADGVAVKKVGELPFLVAKTFVDKVICVSETEILQAFLLLLEKHKLLVEPAGAVATAALINDKLELKNKKIVVILSGGNIDLITMSTLINKGLINLGRVFEFCLDLVNKPGQLVQVAQILSDENANIIGIRHNQFKDVERYHKVELWITVEVAGFAHIERIKQAFRKANYEVKTND